MPSDILKGKKLSIGFDPNLFTEKSLFIFFGKNKYKLKPIFHNLIDEIWKRKIVKNKPTAIIFNTTKGKGIKEFENANWENDIYSVVKNSDCLVILTEWNEFKSMDLKKISDIMDKPIIIDFRNLFSLDEMEKLKIEYHSIGREAVNFNKDTK